jgi:hypothetical protein
MTSKSSLISEQQELMLNKTSNNTVQTPKSTPKSTALPLDGSTTPQIKIKKKKSAASAEPVSNATPGFKRRIHTINPTVVPSSNENGRSAGTLSTPDATMYYTEPVAGQLQIYNQIPKPAIEPGYSSMDTGQLAVYAGASYNQIPKPAFEPGYSSLDTGQLAVYAGANERESMYAEIDA